MKNVDNNDRRQNAHTIIIDKMTADKMTANAMTV